MEAELEEGEASAGIDDNADQQEQAEGEQEEEDEGGGGDNDNEDEEEGVVDEDDVVDEEVNETPDDEEEDDAQLIELREDLVYDEEDRTKLLAMTEVDREMVYAERIEKKERDKERKRLLGQGNMINQDLEEDQRSGIRRETETRNRKDALRELQKRKEEQEQRKHATHDEWGGTDENRKSVGGESDEAGSAEISVSESDNDRGRAHHEVESAEMEPLQEEYAEHKDFASIQVMRSQLERWISEPHFEATIPRCFVRMAEADNSSGTLQRGYRILEVVEVIQKEDQPYKYGERGIVTNKHLKLREGYREHTRGITMVSNQQFLPAEFDRWRQCCERDNRTPLSKQSTAEVHQKILKAGKYTYSAEDVKKILDQKGKRPISNIAAEKIRLKRLCDYHQEQKDMAEVDKLNEQIRELSQVKKVSVRTSRGRSDGMVNVNRRNLRANLKSSSRKKGGAADNSNVFEDGLDPFQRRATRPHKYWKTGGGAEGSLKSAEKTEKKRDQPLQEPDTSKRHRSYEEYFEGVRKLDLSSAKLQVQIPTQADFLVNNILPATVHFSDAQQELEESVVNGSVRSLTLKDYKRLTLALP